MKPLPEPVWNTQFPRKSRLGYFNMDFTPEAMILAASAEKLGERTEASSKEFNGTLREFNGTLREFNTTLRYGIFGFAFTFTALGVAFILKGRPAKLVPRFRGHK